MVQATLPKAAWSERATAFTVRTVDGIGRTLKESVKTRFFFRYGSLYWDYLGSFGSSEPNEN